MSQDLRTFLQRIETKGELVRVSRPVDPNYEIGAICFTELQQRGLEHNRALLFDNVIGCKAPLAVNLVASPRRFFMALDVASREEFRTLWNKAAQNPLAPLVAKREEALCQQEVLEGNDIDLLRFSVPTWNEKDGGPFIDLPCVFSKDPETGERNCGIYRMMVNPDRRSTGLSAAPYRHVVRHWTKAFAQGKPLPIAAAIGVDPAFVIAAAAPLPAGADEMALAGALKGEPIAMVPCRTVPLEVPACAEIVLEGEISSDRWQEEGPFGEVNGYYTGTYRRPVFRVRCITHRRDAISMGTYLGRPPQENALIIATLMEAEILRQCSLPEIKDIHCAVFGSFLTAVVSVRKRFDGYGKTAGLAILSTMAGRPIKNLIVVDEDIDPHDWNQVVWALSTRLNPERGVEILKDILGTAVDPTMDLAERRSGGYRVSKMILDATEPVNLPFPEVCLPKLDVLDRIRKEWK
jgi:4-hydroxy-3-polyprenylbenzoate decarboxylase